jgi:D-serine deaminase-like pyridoxal phosphate-dependent protein
VDVWIELDVGQHRSGIAVAALLAIQQIAVEISRSKQFHLRGALAHAGHLYHAVSVEQVRTEYRTTVERLQELREAMGRQGFDGFEISWGDTPTCSLVEDLSGVDEIRPGNFVFYDAEQLSIGACREEDIAVALACPVVSKPAGLGHAVVHGGAVHLSKEFIEVAGQRLFGEITLPQGNGWVKRLPGAFVRSLSQEHGVVQLKPDDLQSISIGDLLLVLPVHSCLTVDLMQNYLTLDGHPISTLGKPRLT